MCKHSTSLHDVEQYYYYTYKGFSPTALHFDSDDSTGQSDDSTGHSAISTYRPLQPLLSKG